MATVRTMSSASKLFNFKNSIMPVALKLSSAYLTPSLTQLNVPVRWASYGRASKVSSRPVQTEVEIINDPQLWSIVEGLIADTVIQPPKPKAEYPSGWKPPNPNPNLPYFIKRTANHMHSVHQSFRRDTLRRLTVVRNIQGDIWALQKHLVDYLEKLENTYISSSVNEAYRKIYFRGDHESNIKVWMDKQGF